MCLEQMRKLWNQFYVLWSQLVKTSPNKSAAVEMGLLTGTSEVIWASNDWSFNLQNVWLQSTVLLSVILFCANDNFENYI